MRILLIPSFNIINYINEPYIPYGLLSLQAAVCEEDGVVVDIAKFDSKFKYHKFSSSREVVEGFIESIELSGYDVIGLSVVCDSAHYSIDIASKIKDKFPNSLVIMGGPYVTKLSSNVLATYPFIDAVFIGEAEVSFRSFVRNYIGKVKSIFSIDGVKTRGKNYTQAMAGNLIAIQGGAENVNKYTQTPVVDNLDDLPSIIYSKDYFGYILDSVNRQDNEFSIPLEATRGCPLKCSFCSTKQVWGAKVRRKSACKLVDEMKYISGIANKSFFSLIGDNVGVPRKPFMRFCDDMIRENNGFEWAVSLKLDRYSRKHLEKMWLAGCRGLFIGVESASQDTLRKVNKAAILKNEIEAIETAIKMGFQVEISLIIGFPWEEEDDVRATYDLHCKFIKSGARKSQVLILSPIPGTEIVENEDVSFSGWRSNLSQDNVALSPEHMIMVEDNPNLFTHFGYYETPKVSRRILKAYRDAASQIGTIHANRMKKAESKTNFG